MSSYRLESTYDARLKRKIVKLMWRSVHVDPFLLFLLFILAATSLFILYSAGGENIPMIVNQGIRLFAGLVVMIIFAQIPPHRYYQWAPWIFGIAVVLLVLVLVFGSVYQGGRRWLGFGSIRFQPSEIMKLAMPMMLAWFMSRHILPPRIGPLLFCVILITIPVILIAKQPDLGTAILVAASALSVLFFAGTQWRLIISVVLSGAAMAPILWHFFLHEYQKTRVLTFINPERDPLGSGYHIIQSKIAIGSGGMFGKGYMEGTQSHLSFLPAHTTDFIFAVSGEELGFIGCVLIVALFLIIFGRCLFISIKAQNTFTRLLAGSLALTFMISAFVNMGMVIGILPVVGIPLPLISYGGSSMITFMASFGMLMSIHTHRKLWGT